VPGLLTDITEIATALGTLSPDLGSAFATRPNELSNVPDIAWHRLVDAYDAGQHAASFATAFENGDAFLGADEGLRGRRPRLVEWKGPHRSPGDDVIPADLRVDHVYLVSCKYLSRVLLNVGPARLFERLLIGEERTSTNWFHTTAPDEFQRFYAEALAETGLTALPSSASALSTADQRQLKEALRPRALPPGIKGYWATLCDKVATESARRWSDALSSRRLKLRMLWRLLRIGGVSYFVLGTANTEQLRLRVASAWDWNQAFELREFGVAARAAGQPEIAWHAIVRDRVLRTELQVVGHVEVRWSHGRFLGLPEAKVYLDSPHSTVPGYYALV